MNLDIQKIEEILERENTLYGKEAKTRKDKRLHSYTGDYIMSQISSDMRVFDVGCGHGATLIREYRQLKSGLGIDYDTSRHLGWRRC